MGKKVRLGVIGAGGFSAYHLDGIESARNCDIVAISDIVEENAKQRAEQYHIPYYYQDYRELLKRDDIDAVTLPIPDQVHMQVTVDALHAGKHVLCEKPMALNMEDCKKMIYASRETGKLLMVGQLGRYTPHFNMAKEMADRGDIGELFYVESEYAHDYSHIGGKGGWRMTPERHAVLGGGCHAVDLLRRIAGNPTEVFAYANHKVLTDWPVDDCTVAVLTFPNNVIGKVMTSIGCKRNYTMRTVLYGTKGTLIVNSKLPYISMFRERFSEEDCLKDQYQQVIELKIPVPINDHDFKGEVTDFCNAVLNGKLVECTGEEGAVTVSACLAIVESVKMREKVQIEYNFLD